MLTGLQEKGLWCPVLLGGASTPPCGVPLGPPAPATFSPTCPRGPKIQAKGSGPRATGLAFMWVSRCCLGRRQEGQPGSHLLLADHSDHTGCQLCPSWEQILERNCLSVTWVTPPTRELMSRRLRQGSSVPIQPAPLGLASPATMLPCVVAGSPAGGSHRRPLW